MLPIYLHKATLCLHALVCSLCASFIRLAVYIDMPTLSFTPMYRLFFFLVSCQLAHGFTCTFPYRYILRVY